MTISRRVVVIVTMALSVLLLWRWKSNQNYATLVQFLTQQKTPQQNTFDIVLAHYSEPLDELRQQIQILKNVPAIASLAPRAIVYTKGLTPDSTYEQQETLRQELDADILRILPNVGREGDTYLAHIVEHHDELARHTLFAQAHMELLERATKRLQNHFTDRLAAMSLGPYDTCSCDACFVYPTNPDPVHGFKRVPQLYSIFNECLCPPEGLLLTFKGQFVVSRQRITRNSREKFIWLRSILTNMTHFVHDDPVEGNNMSGPGFDNKIESPLFGHTLERSWMFIFGCNDLTLLRTCGDERCGCYD